MKPFVEYPVKQLRSQSTGAVMLFNDESRSFDQSTVRTVKSWLARGFPVLAGMYVERDANSFYSYKGSTAFGAAHSCGAFHTDHQVMFVGYGYKHGKEVWILKNSWGPQWGSEGFFYVEIGTNAYCTEHYAFGVVPKNVMIDDIAFKEVREPAIVVERGSALGIDYD